MKKLFNGFLILLLLAGNAWAADPAYEIGSGSIMSSPPAIGAVAPNTGKFTTLDATGDFKVVGHSSLDSTDFVGNVHTSTSSTATFDGPVIVNGAFNYTGQVQGTADNINIGQVAPGKGKFTTLEATGGIIGALTGNASTSTALAGNPTDCSANNFATAIDASGNLTCAQVTSSGISGSLTQNTSGNAATATALASNPTDCSAGQFANAIDAGGNLTCAAPSGGGITFASDRFLVSQAVGQGNTTTVSGLGFTPSLVFINCAYSGAIGNGYGSFGQDDGVHPRAVYDYNGAAWTETNSRSIYVSNGTNYMIGHISQLNSGNFVVLWDLVSGTITTTCDYTAFK